MNTRKDNNGVAMKKWLATPPGHIAKPLRHIANRDNFKNPDGTISYGPKTKEAARASKRGWGSVVRDIARSI